MSEAKTDPRLIGIERQWREIALTDMTHAEVTRFIRTDFAEFMARPTSGALAILIAELLSYQDSVVLGRKRKAA